MQPVKVSGNGCYVSVYAPKRGHGNPLDICSTNLLGMQPVKVSGNICDVSAKCALARPL